MAKFLFVAAFLLFSPVTILAATDEPLSGMENPETVFGKSFFCLNGTLHLKQGDDLVPVYVHGGKLGCPKCDNQCKKSKTETERPSIADSIDHTSFVNN